MSQNEKEVKGASQGNLKIKFWVDDYYTGNSYLKVSVNLQVEGIRLSTGAIIKYFDYLEVEEYRSLEISKTFPAAYKKVSQIEEDISSFILNILFLEMIIQKIKNGREIQLGLKKGNKFSLRYNPLKELCRINLDTNDGTMDSSLKVIYPKDKMIGKLKGVVKDLKSYARLYSDYTAEEYETMNQLLSMVKNDKV